MRAIFVVVLAACSRTPDAEPGPGTAPETEALAATCVGNPVIAPVLDCTWTSPEPGAGTVEFWPDGDPAAVRTTPATPSGTTHDVAVLGLAASETYAYRVVVDDGARRWESPVETYTVPDVPPEFPVFTLEVADAASSELASGYLMFASAVLTSDRFTALAIVDGAGRYVWWHRTPQYGLAISPRFSRDGASLMVLQTDMLWEADVGTVHRVGLDGDEASETRALLGHHAMWENADGTLTWLGFDYETFDDLYWASDVLRTAPEGTPEGVEPTEEFSWFDAYEVDPFSAVPGENFVSIGDALEWTHSNSLMAIDDESFFVMSKLLDCLLKIDRATGAITWQLGGRFGDFTLPDGTAPWRSVSDNDLFSHSHMSHLWDGGLAVFDNADHTGKHSRAVVYALDEDARTVEEVWSYEEPDGLHTASMGDVRVLEGGNTVIGWSSLGYISEVTPSGEVVWQLRMDLPGHIGRVTPLTDLYAPPDASQP